MDDAKPTSYPLYVTGPGGRGDLDGDGGVTVTDASWALQILVGLVKASPGVLRSADAAPKGGVPQPAGWGDGVLDLRDVIAILRLSLGLET